MGNRQTVPRCAFIVIMLASLFVASLGASHQTARVLAHSSSDTIPTATPAPPLPTDSPTVAAGIPPSSGTPAAVTSPTDIAGTPTTGIGSPSPSADVTPSGPVDTPATQPQLQRLTSPMSSGGSETLTVPFNRGMAGTTSANSYSGSITLRVTGTGQAAGCQYSDAFYIYADCNGNAYNPPQHYAYYYNWVLMIDSQPIDHYVSSIPAYRSDHDYTFTIAAPGGPLAFGVADAGTADNTGAYVVAIQAASLVGSRYIVFVHGVKDNYRSVADMPDTTQPSEDQAWSSIVPWMKRTYGDGYVLAFKYYQDLGLAMDPTKQSSPCQQPQPEDTSGAGFIPLVTKNDPIPGTAIYNPFGGTLKPAIKPAQWCDSQPDFGLNVEALDTFLAALPQDGKPVTIFAYSMGATTVRGWLALAQRQPSSRGAELSRVDSIIFDQGVQQGSYLAKLATPLGKGAVIKLWGPIANPLMSAVNGFGFNPDRPAMYELAPQTQWFNSINKAGDTTSQPPANIRYYNFYSNIHLSLYVDISVWHHNVFSKDLGDTVILPGNDTPQDTPQWGGAMFRPSGADNEWVMANSYSYNILNSWPWRGPTSAWGDPRTHLNLAKYMGTQVTVPDCTSGQQITVAEQIEHILVNPIAACS